MQIEVSAETGRKINELLASGKYENADVLIGQVLERIEQERSYLREIAPLLAEGVQSLKEGRTREVTPELAEEIIAAGIQRSATRLGRSL